MVKIVIDTLGGDRGPSAVVEGTVSAINENKDIDYIDGADHGYTEKETELAEQIIKFIKKYK